MKRLKVHKLAANRVKKIVRRRVDQIVPIKRLVHSCKESKVASIGDAGKNRE